MKTTDIRSMSVADLQTKIEEAEKEYQILKMGHKISPVENPIKVRTFRKEIARYKTILTEKLAEQN